MFEGEKNGAKMAPASYRVSLGQIILRFVHEMGYFDEILPNNETKQLEDDDIKYFMSTVAKIAKINETDSNII